MAKTRAADSFRNPIFPAKLSDRLALAAFAVGLAWTLTPKGDAPSDFRSLTQIWDIGHFLLFFLLGHLFYVYRPQFAKARPARQIGILMIAAFLIGGIIEALQYFIPSRTSSFSDMAANIAGIVGYLSFRHRRKSGAYALLHLSAICITGAIFWQPVRSVIDESTAWWQFPRLAGFETPLEVDRFEARTAGFRISGETAYQGKKSLRLDLIESDYSGVWLRHLQRDWQGFSSVHFAACNPEPETVSFHVRVQDEHNYRDSFDRMFPLEPGWNAFDIPLTEVRKGPEVRDLDLSRIRRIGFYVARPSQPMTLYIDDIRLR